MWVEPFSFWGCIFVVCSEHGSEKRTKRKLRDCGGTTRTSGKTTGGKTTSGKLELEHVNFPLVPSMTAPSPPPCSYLPLLCTASAFCLAARLRLHTTARSICQRASRRQQHRTFCSSTRTAVALVELEASLQATYLWSGAARDSGRFRRLRGDRFGHYYGSAAVGALMGIMMGQSEQAQCESATAAVEHTQGALDIPISLL